MATLTVTSAQLVKGDDEHQLTLPAGVNISAGQAIRPDASISDCGIHHSTRTRPGPRGKSKIKNRKSKMVKPSPSRRCFAP